MNNIEIIEHINPEEFVEGNGLVINEVIDDSQAALEVELEDVIENAVEVAPGKAITEHPSSPSSDTVENFENSKQRSSEEE